MERTDFTEESTSIKRVQDLKEEKRIIEVEKERTQRLLEMKTKECDILWERTNRLETDLRVIKKTKGYRIVNKCWKLIDIVKGRKEIQRECVYDVVDENKKQKNKKEKIALIVDRPDWAFDHIADQIKKNLNQYYDFKVIYACDIENVADIFILSQDCKIVHFFWRGLLSSYDSEWVQNRIFRLGYTKEEFFSKYIKNKKISTEIYDHLCLDDEEKMVTEKLFARKESILTAYAVSSKKLERIYQEKVELKKRPDAYLPDGVDLNLFQPNNLSRFDNLNDRLIRVGWVGNSKWSINDLKGINTIIKPAIQELRQEGYNIELYTSDREEKMIPHYRMPQFYSKIDCYICASLHEGTPNPVLEAMACGVPVITTNVGVVEECLGTLQKNFIMKERTVKELKEKIIKLLKNREVFKELSNENLENIKQWDWKIQTENFRKYFEFCLNKRNG